MTKTKIDDGIKVQHMRIMAVTVSHSDDGMFAISITMDYLNDIFAIEREIEIDGGDVTRGSLVFDYKGRTLIMDIEISNLCCGLSRTSIKVLTN